MKKAMRDLVIEHLCKEERLDVMSGQFLKLSVSEKILSIVSDELDSYDDYDEVMAAINGGVLPIKVYCNEDWGIDIGFRYKNIDFEYLDVMVEWEDIPDSDIEIMSKWQ